MEDTWDKWMGFSGTHLEAFLSDTQGILSSSYPGRKQLEQGFLNIYLKLGHRDILLLGHYMKTFTVHVTGRRSTGTFFIGTSFQFWVACSPSHY